RPGPLPALVATQPRTSLSVAAGHTRDRSLRTRSGPLSHEPLQVGLGVVKLYHVAVLHPEVEQRSLVRQLDAVVGAFLHHCHIPAPGDSVYRRRPHTSAGGTTHDEERIH